MQDNPALSQSPEIALELSPEIPKQASINW